MEEYKKVKIDGEITDYYISKSGDVLSAYKNKIKRLKVFKTKKGYLYVKLWIHGKSKAVFIHRLVATAYIANPENKPEVNHKNGDKSVNYDWNLEWVTSKENKKHAKLMGLVRYANCEDVWDSKYTNNQIERVCELMQKNELSLKKISDKTNVDIDTLYYIRSKKGWRKISKKYNFPKNPKYNCKVYDENLIHKVCKYLESGKSIKEIKNKTGVKESTIRDIKKKRRWKQISSLYNF